MSPDISSENKLTSYKFEDYDDYVVVEIYANGAVEWKDIDVLTESDSLDVKTPNERWMFELYDHVYADRIEVETEINENKTQTTIKLRLQKHNTQQKWPQLYNNLHIPVISQRNIENIDSNDKQEQPYELSFKRITHDFTETKNEAIVHIMIKQVFDCEVQFTATNFTATFHSNDEDFLREHSITSKTPIKLLVRVKERIIPAESTYSVTTTYISIIAIKDYKFHLLWKQIEANEYFESRPSTITHPLSTNSTNLTMNTLNRAIPLPAPRSMGWSSDNHNIGSSFHQKDMTNSSSTTPPGFTGIYNPANSCFMNAALQCLSNTRELRDYFLQSYHFVEINRSNPLGMNGAMAEELANVLKNLWSGQMSFTYANTIRDYAAKRHTEFVGNGQHDAQELLTIILDAIHEDLNRVITKPLVPPIEDNNRPDDILADEYWKGYLSRNDSLIVQLFTGQFKSKTKCPQCNKESVTFDPFTSISVPIPKRVAIDTIVTYRTDERPPIKYRISMSGEGTIGDLKRLLSHKAGLSITKMLAYKIQSNRTIEYFKDEDHVPSSTYSWHNSDLIYITEVLTSAECDNEKIVYLTFYQRIFRLADYVLACAYCQSLPNPNSSPKFCKKCYRVSYCDQHCQNLHASDHKYACGFRSSDNYETIGLPFVISLPESKLTCTDVFEQIKIHAKRSVDINIENSKETRRVISIGHELDDYGAFIENDEDDSFSDIENADWTTIKSTLSSSDSWSICRIGDYFAKTHRTKRLQQQQKDQGDKLPNSHNNNEDESMVTSGDSSSESSTGDFDMLDDIYGNQPLFRIMPQPADSYNNHNDDTEQYRPIIEHGDDANRILRGHTTFSIDWFTDNKNEAPLRVTPSKNRSGINNLIEDESVTNSTSGDQDVTLQQCLQLFIEPEVLGPDDKWYCPHCKEHIQAEKKMSIWRLPPILIIHLKRFKYNQSSSFGYMSNTREKIESTVKFPPYDLNMAPYCSSVFGENQDQNDSPQSRYDLYGVINHRGTAWFGHYTSNARLLAYNDAAKTEIGWRTFDDERVSTLPNVKDIVRSDAYVLFYRNRHLSVNISIQEQLQRIIAESTK